MKKLFVIITAAVVLTACAKAPDEVQRENDVLNSASVADARTMSGSDDKQKHDKSIKDEGIDIQYASMEEIRSSLNEVQKNNKTNVVVKSVRVGNGRSMAAYKPKKINKNYDDIGRIVEDLYGEKYDKSNWEKGDKEKYIKDDYALEVNGEVKGKTTMLNYCADGLPMGSTQELFTTPVGKFSFGGTSPVDKNKRFPQPEKVIKTYKIFAGDDPGEDKYKMSDGKELMVKEAIKCGEDFYNTYVAALRNDGITYKVNILFVHEFSDGTHGFSYYMDLFDRNGNIHGASLLTASQSVIFGKDHGLYFFNDSFEGLTIDSKNQPFCFTGYNRDVDEVIEAGDKLVTYASALEIVSGTLATSAMYEMDSATLEYVLVCPYKDGLIDYDEKTKQYGIMEENVAYLSGEPQIRPYWVFRDLSKSGYTSAISGGMVFVDALTGEVYVR